MSDCMIEIPMESVTASMEQDHSESIVMLDPIKVNHKHKAVILNSSDGNASSAASMEQDHSESMIDPIKVNHKRKAVILNSSDGNASAAVNLYDEDDERQEVQQRPSKQVKVALQSSIHSQDQPKSKSKSTDPFRLSQLFVNQYRRRKAPFGYNGLGELVYLRTYSRKKADGVTNEQWFETVERVVNGTFSMQKRWLHQHHLPWYESEKIKQAQEMYERIFEMQFLPPGRGLFCMGSPVTEERGLHAALNNCAFVSTTDIDRGEEDARKPFIFLMDASMLGVGVGFDTKGAGKLKLQGPDPNAASWVFQIPDSREGWVQALDLLLDSHFHGRAPVTYDYSLIRVEGTPIKGFGGVASGPACLQELLTTVGQVLERRGAGGVLTITDIADIMNMIAKCVVNANLRRSALISFGDANSDEYINLKNYKLNPQRADYGWTSNNSVFATLGMDYHQICQRIQDNGEPGFAFLENMKQYSRMNGPPDNKDYRVCGGNPCLEQSLEPFELCCLVETFPNRHKSLEDFHKTLKCALLYAKTVTLGATGWKETNAVMARNRRIGTSVSGIAQFLGEHTLHELRNWLNTGYDVLEQADLKYSEEFAIPRSIKLTSVKPSGTVSLLNGSTPGVHYPESRFYIRRMRLATTSELLEPLRAAHYPLVWAEKENSWVVEIPIDVGEGVRTSKEVSMWEQLSLAAFMQEHYASNQVSATITFDPKTEGHQLEHALNYFQYKLKGISFLPRIQYGAYPLMPYEAIDEAEFKKRQDVLLPINFSHTSTSAADKTIDRFCDNDSCTQL